MPPKGRQRKGGKQRKLQDIAEEEVEEEAVAPAVADAPAAPAAHAQAAAAAQDAVDAEVAALQQAQGVLTQLLELDTQVDDVAEEMWAETWSDVEHARAEFRLLFAKVPKKVRNMTVAELLNLPSQEASLSVVHGLWHRLANAAPSTTAAAAAVPPLAPGTAVPLTTTTTTTTAAAGSGTADLVATAPPPATVTRGKRQQQQQQPPPATHADAAAGAGAAVASPGDGGRQLGLGRAALPQEAPPTVSGVWAVGATARVTRRTAARTQQQAMEVVPATVMAAGTVRRTVRRRPGVAAASNALVAPEPPQPPAPQPPLPPMPAAQSGAPGGPAATAAGELPAQAKSVVAGSGPVAAGTPVRQPLGALAANLGLPAQQQVQGGAPGQTTPSAHYKGEQAAPAAAQHTPEAPAAAGPLASFLPGVAGGAFTSMATTRQTRSRVPPRAAGAAADAQQQQQQEHVLAGLTLIRRKAVVSRTRRARAAAAASEASEEDAMVVTTASGEQVVLGMDGSGLAALPANQRAEVQRQVEQLHRLAAAVLARC